MAHNKSYNGSIELASGVKAKNSGTFALVDAEDIQVKEDGTRLPAALDEKVNVNQGAAYSGKALVIDEQGNVVPGEAGVAIDDTLTAPDKAASAKAVGGLRDDMASQPFSAAVHYGKHWHYNGTLVTRAGAAYTDKVPVKAGDTFTVVSDAYANAAAYIVFSGDTVVDYGKADTNDGVHTYNVTIGDNATHIAFSRVYQQNSFSVSKTSYDSTVGLMANVVKVFELMAETVNDHSLQLGELKSDIAELDESVLHVATKELVTENMVNLDTLTAERGLENGNVVENPSKYSTYSVSDYEYAKPDMTYSAWRYAGTGAISLLTVACYDKDKKYIGDASKPASNVFTTLPRTYYVRFCSGTSNLTASRQPSINEGATATPYKPYYNDIVSTYTEYVKLETYNKDVMPLANSAKVVKPVYASAANLSDGQKLEIPYSEVTDTKQNNVIAFCAKVGSFSKLTISHSVANYRSGILEIDKTANEVRVYDGSTLNNKYSLTLALLDFIQVTISVKRNSKADIIITDAAGVQQITDATWDGCRDGIVVTSVGSTLTDCRLSFVCNDILNDIWAYGDSYFDMIPPRLINAGYTRMMVDGFSGRTSAQALVSLQKAAAIRRPKAIIWAMGMNDPDSSTAISSTWKTAFDAVLDYCRANEVELIGYIVPNVPDRSHNFKNAYVRENCDRYIDANHAVGADMDVNWYAGALYSDKVHPATQGRWMIAQEYMRIVPELYDCK